MESKSIKVPVILSLILITLLSGCIEVTVHQKIKRSGKYDFNLTFRSDSKELLNSIKSGFEVNDPTSKKLTYLESKDSISYVFTDLDPRTDLIVAPDIAEGKTGSPQKKVWDLKKEFRFPYYYYTITWDLTQDTKQKESESELGDYFGKAFDEMFKMGYIVEVFGKITETNGLRMEDNKVRFDVGMSTNKKYYVTFRDFFLFSWIGALFGGTVDVGVHPIALILLVLEAFFIVGYVIFVLLVLVANHLTGKLSGWKYYHYLQIAFFIGFVLLILLVLMTLIAGIVFHKEPGPAKPILKMKEMTSFGEFLSSEAGGTSTQQLVSGAAKKPSASCSDGIQNSDEADVDCGGDCMVRCKYSADHCISGHGYAYKTSSGNIANLTERGLTTKDGLTCCHITAIVVGYNSVRHEAYYCERGTDFSEMYDVDGGITGTKGAYIGKRYYDSLGNVVNETSCVDGIKNQGEERADCGGPCKACPRREASLEILKVETSWTDYTILDMPSEGSISQISYRLKNTGEVEIDPSFDIYFSKGATTLDEKYGESGFIWSIKPGETKMEDIWYNLKVTEKGTYTVKVNLRDGSDAEIITTASKQVTV